MNAADILTLPMLAAITGLLVAVIGALAGGIAVVIKALHDVNVTAAKIETSVNSEKTAAQGREVNLRNENALLRELLTDHKNTAALLAQAAATRIQTETPMTGGTPDATVVLDKIEANTAATADGVAQLQPPPGVERFDP